MNAHETQTALDEANQHVESWHICVIGGVSFNAGTLLDYITALTEEVQRHQVGEGYEVGHDHGSAVAVKFKERAVRWEALARQLGERIEKLRDAAALGWSSAALTEYAEAALSVYRAAIKEEG